MKISESVLLGIVLVWLCLVCIVAAGIYWYTPAPEMPFGIAYGSHQVTVIDMVDAPTDARDIQNIPFRVIKTNRGKFMVTEAAYNEMKIGETYAVWIWGSQIHGIIKEGDEE